MNMLVGLVFAQQLALGIVPEGAVSCNARIDPPFWMVWSRNTVPRCWWLTKTKPRQVPKGTQLYWCPEGKAPCKPVAIL
jgi:hypothetical protein